MKPDELYKSNRRNAELDRTEIGGTGRGWDGRFLSKFSGAVCDRIGCEEPIEAVGRRFCVTHRQEHGRRLLGQLDAIWFPPSLTPGEGE